jgi:NAD(P)H-hydrate epimerase
MFILEKLYFRKTTIMKIFSADQIKEIDQHTIKNEPIPSIKLMERASKVFVNWIKEQHPSSDLKVAIFCGPGNNGGDGLAAARLLQNKAYNVHVFLCRIGDKLSPDCELNLSRLPFSKGLTLNEITIEKDLPNLNGYDLLVDAIFGSGLSRPVFGYWGKLITHINDSKIPKYSIDIPSGLFADKKSEGNIIQANRTLSFEFPKLSFMFPENQTFVGEWESRSIGLSIEAIESNASRNYYIDRNLIQRIRKTRTKFQHKGNFGHALIAGGSWGKMGAISLAANACLRAGAGLVTCYVPGCGYEIIQSTVPEAMVITDTTNTYLSEFKSDLIFDTAGIGCGMGKGPAVKAFIKSVLTQIDQPLVLDADALNNLAEDSELMSDIPNGSILTPHLKEFTRIFGVSHDDFERHELQKEMSRRYKCIIILKGAHSCITSPEGLSYFNSTGNPGMATAGSGDVLTGIITALLGQGYSSEEAAILGVYLHGLAGDLAAKVLSEESLIAGDIIKFLPNAFNSLSEL